MRFRIVFLTLPLWISASGCSSSPPPMGVMSDETFEAEMPKPDTVPHVTGDLSDEDVFGRIKPLPYDGPRQPLGTIQMPDGTKLIPPASMTPAPLGAIRGKDPNM